MGKNKTNTINLDEIRKKEQIKKVIEDTEDLIFVFGLQELFLQRLNIENPNPETLKTLANTQIKIESQKKWLEFLREKQKEYETYGN